MAKQEKKRSRDYTAPNIEVLEKELKELYVSGANPKRKEEVKSILDFLFWGIK